MRKLALLGVTVAAVALLGARAAREAAEISGLEIQIEKGESDLRPLQHVLAAQQQLEQLREELLKGRMAARGSLGHAGGALSPHAHHASRTPPTWLTQQQQGHSSRADELRAELAAVRDRVRAARALEQRLPQIRSEIESLTRRLAESRSRSGARGR